MDTAKPTEAGGQHLGGRDSSTNLGKETRPGGSQQLGGSGNVSGGAGSSYMGGVAGDTGSHVGATVERNAEQLHHTIDKAAEQTQPIVDRLATSAHAGVDKLQSALSGVSSTLDDKSRQLSEAYGRFLETGRDYVRNKPATSVLIAVAAGWALARLLGSRRD